MSRVKLTEGEIRYASFLDPISNRPSRRAGRIRVIIFRGPISGELLAQEIGKDLRIDPDNLCAWSKPVTDPGPAIKRKRKDRQ